MFDSVFSFLLSLIEGAYHTQRGVLYTLACAFALFVFFSWRIIQLLKEPPPRILYASRDLALFVFFSWRIIQLLKTLFSHDLYASLRFRPLCFFSWRIIQLLKALLSRDLYASLHKLHRLLLVTT